MMEANTQRNINSTTQQELVLESFFKNERPLASLIIIQDCPSQAGLPIICHLIQQLAINSAETQQGHVLLIKTNPDLLLDQVPKIQSTFDSVDNQLPSEFIDVARLAQRNHQSEQSDDKPKFDLNNLLQLVCQAISRLDTTTHKLAKPLSILVDSVQELFRLFSIHQTFLFIKNLLNLLPNPESRVVILDSPHLNLEANNDCLEKIIEPSMALRSLALSTSHLHLRIHPTTLIDHLINDLGLPVPMQSTKQSGTHYDLRLFQLIDELTPSCNPYLATNSPAKQDGVMTIPQALLIDPNSSSSVASNHLGSCVIEWTAKNLQSSCSSRPSTSIKPHFKESTKSSKIKSSANLSSVQHGLEALQLLLDPCSSFQFQLTPVPISKIIKKRSFRLSRPTRSDSTLDPLQSQLTFNLSLTDKQRVDREAIELPFLPKRSKDGAVIEAPGEIFDGSFRDSHSKRSSGGLILYEPDSADDYDDEEPDDD